MVACMLSVAVKMGKRGTGECCNAREADTVQELNSSFLESFFLITRILVDWNLGRDTPSLVRSAPLIEKQPNNESIIATAYDNRSHVMIIATRSMLQVMSMDTWEMTHQAPLPQVKSLLLRRQHVSVSVSFNVCVCVCV
jgi:hypothetical protein